MTRKAGVAAVALCVWAVSADRPACGQELAVAESGQVKAQPGPPAVERRPPPPREPGRPHSFDFSVSFGVFGPSDLGSRVATLTPNQIGSTTPYTYFGSGARLQAAPGVDLRVGYAVTRAVVVEGAMTYNRPGVSLTVDQDAEGATGFTATAEHLAQYSIGAAVRVYITPLSFKRGRGRPFVTGSVGYLRQLHEGRTAITTGSAYSVGGGVSWLLRARRAGLLPGLAMQGIGLRADARVNFATGGFTVDVSRRVYGWAGGGLFIGF